MLYLLAALLLLVFFLPDIIGPFPALAVGSIVIAFAFYVYSRWSKEQDHEVESGKSESTLPGNDEEPL